MKQKVNRIAVERRARSLAGAANKGDGSRRLYDEHGRRVVVRLQSGAVLVVNGAARNTAGSIRKPRPVRYSFAEAKGLKLYDEDGAELTLVDVVASLGGGRRATPDGGGKRSVRKQFERADAQERLAKKRKTRAIVVGVAEEGMSQTEVAALADLSQAQVSRIIKASGRDALAPTPNEIIDERDAGEIDDAVMLAKLIDLDCTYDQHLEGGNPTVEAFVPGTWSQVEQAFQDDRLTYDQYRLIVLAHAQELRDSAAR